MNRNYSIYCFFFHHIAETNTAKFDLKKKWKLYFKWQFRDEIDVLFKYMVHNFKLLSSIDIFPQKKTREGT